MQTSRHSINVSVDDSWIKVNNLNNDLIKVEFIDIESNRCLYQSTNMRLGFSLCNYFENKNIRIYLREHYSGGVDFHVYDIIIFDNRYELYKIETEDNFNFEKNIFLINGFAGGGTSIVTKFFKYLGINAGDDSGPLTSRKPHEAYGIKLWVKSITKDLPIIHHKQNFLKVSKTYGFQDRNVNVIKIPESHQIINNLSEIFPNLKVLSVIKNPTSYFVTSEGERFHNQSELDIYKIQHPSVEGVPIFHVDFIKFFTDFQYVNKVLKYLGWDDLIQTQEQFEFIKKQIDFIPKVLE